MIRQWLDSVAQYFGFPSTAQRGRGQRELQEEFAFHLLSSAEEHFEAGADLEESQRVALSRFGAIQDVLQECSRVAESRAAFWHRVHALSTLALLCAVGYLFHNWLTLSRETAIENADSLAASGYTLAQTNGDIVGTVTDEIGRPMTAANILVVVKTWPNNGYRQQAYTAASRTDGTFEIRNVYPPEQDYEIQIAAIADRRLLQSQYFDTMRGKLGPIHFRLEASPNLSLHFESEAGEPIEGVSVFPFERIEASGKRHRVYFDSAEPIICKSNASGTVAMPHFLPGERASVFVRFPGEEWNERQLVIPPEQDEVVITRPKNESQT